MPEIRFRTRPASSLMFCYQLAFVIASYSVQIHMLSAPGDCHHTLIRFLLAASQSEKPCRTTSLSSTQRRIYRQFVCTSRSNARRVGHATIYQQHLVDYNQCAEPRHRDTSGGERNPEKRTNQSEVGTGFWTRRRQKYGESDWNHKVWLGGNQRKRVGAQFRR